MRTNKRLYIGIIGGGQLGLMLAEAVVKITGHEPVFYVDTPASPAEKAGFLTVTELETFIRQVDLVLIENEWIPLERLQELKTKYPEIRFWPTLDSLADLRNKKSQKKFLQRNDLPTAPFEDYSLKSLSDLGGCVIKRGTHSYDGTGNFAIPPGKTFSKEKLLQFLSSSEASDFYIEAWVPFVAEAALVCGTREKEFFHYPLVKTVQSQNVCQWVEPLPEPLKVFEPTAIQIARTIAEKSGIEGVFAVEFFITEDGELLVNEIAPRVHNSGHFTRTACEVSQFDLQVLLALGMPVAPKSLEPTSYFGMLNILGDQSVQTDTLSKTKRFEYKDYLKNETRPGRKMGHVAFATDNLVEFETLRHTLFLKDSES